VETDQRCYRHPDRRGGVICQRCDRPICPDCMHQASVGFHCPECTKASGQRVVTAGQLRGGAGGLLVTNLLIAANVAVFVAGLGGGLETKSSVIFDGGLAGPLVASGEWWRIFSSGFLHANLIHIGFNCLVLYQLGQLVEPVLGRVRFAAAYVCSMVAGSFGVLVLDPNAFTVGASGAVFGMMGVAVALMRQRGINPFQTSLGGTIMLNLLLTFSIRGISIGGHVGGLLGGLVAGWLLTELGERARSPLAPVGAVLALTGALVAGSLLIA
jgi:membrane associated rhomboid family serine protease